MKFVSIFLCLSLGACNLLSESKVSSAFSIAGDLAVVTPVITSMTPPVDAGYFNGSPLTFTVTFSQAVFVTGTPFLPITIAGTVRQASYSSGSGTSQLIFSYNPPVAELDLDGIEFSGSNLDLNGGSIRDAGLVDASLTYPSIPSLVGVNVIFPSMTHWYDLSDSASIIVEVDGVNEVVSQLTDKIGSSHVTASGVARPRYYASGFGTGNTAYIAYNGSSSAMSWAILPIIQSAVIVFRSRTTKANFTLMATPAAGAQTSRMAVAPQGANTLILHSGSAGNGQQGDFRANGGVFTGTFTNSKPWNWTISTNYILQMRWQVTQGGVASPLGGVDFDGAIAEVILFSSQLSAAQSDVLRNWLNTKHGVY